MPELSPSEITAYLDRIGVVDSPLRPDINTLRQLHRAHVWTVPFENLSVHLGEEISLEVPALVDKIVIRRRGGFCYELNGLFAALLEAIGFGVERLSARTYSAKEEVFAHPLDHVALRVTDAQGGVWLADVGFGRHSELPLNYAERGEQADPFGTLLLVDGADGQFDVLLDGTPQYRVDPRALALSDFEPGRWWQITSPDSLFRRNLMCSLPAPDGRVTLNGRRLIRTDAEGRHESLIGQDAAVLAAYRDLFGIELTVVPAVV